MPLSNTERQKRWRDRQKEKNPNAFMEKERKRKRESYVPVEKLGQRAHKKRKIEVNERVKRHYLKKKTAQMTTVMNVEEGPSTSTRCRRTGIPLLVKIPTYERKGKGTRKRYKSSLKNAQRKIEELEEKNTVLNKSNKRIQKRIERIRAASTKNHDSSDADIDTTLETDETSAPISPCMTPRSKTKALLDRLKLTPSGRKILCKRLFFANCITKDLKEAVSSVNNNVIKKLPFYTSRKYRFMSELRRKTGIGRKIPTKRTLPTKKQTAKQKLQTQLTSFLEREDNSSVLVSKKKSDVLVIENKEHQKRILSDYIHNLHEKFRLENPEVKVSQALFYRSRPKYFLLANFASRKTCLCSRHQNMALKLKAMRALRLNLPKSPDSFIKEQDTNEKLKQTLETGLPDMVKFTQWKKVAEGQKTRWKEVEETVSKVDFITLMESQTTEFRNHVERVKIQYHEMRKLRENLPENEIVLWMDFAENFICTSVEAVQSSYWNQAMVSLHTMVVYFPKSQGQRLQSFVAVSDVLSHNATVVYTILRKLIPMLKATYPTLRTIHYLTDSPTSQYRNKTIFKILADHVDDFGISGRWNYLESGHGKGPCDGLGACIKRSADMAIRQGKCLIQNAEDFYAWSKKTEESGSKIKYISYNQEDVGRCNDILEQKEKPTPISGTFKLHAIIPTNSFTILTRETSCYCNDCLENPRNSIHQWKEQFICRRQEDPIVDENLPQGKNEEHVVEITANEISHDSDDQMRESEENSSLEIQPSDWVSAIYENNYYFGQVVTVDTGDDEVEINFLAKSGKYGKAFKMPSREDKIWIERKNVLTILEKEPRSVGKSKRLDKMFQINRSEIERTEKAFNVIK